MPTLPDDLVSDGGDIIVTWPKVKPLDDYVAELQSAAENRLEINFRVPHPPLKRPHRCYIVHSNYVRGWNVVIDVVWRGEGEVARVGSDAFAGFWPAGYYIVRDPEWHPVKPIEMRGFQGWRYFDRERTEDVHT